MTFAESLLNDLPPLKSFEVFKARMGLISSLERNIRLRSGHFCVGVDGTDRCLILQIVNFLVKRYKIKWGFNPVVAKKYECNDSDIIVRKESVSNNWLCCSLSSLHDLAPFLSKGILRQFLPNNSKVRNLKNETKVRYVEKMPCEVKISLLTNSIRFGFVCRDCDFVQDIAVLDNHPNIVPSYNSYLNKLYIYGCDVVEVLRVEKQRIAAGKKNILTLF